MASESNNGECEPAAPPRGTKQTPGASNESTLKQQEEERKYSEIWRGAECLGESGGDEACRNQPTGHILS
jgi:hypothetical protein